MTNLPTERPGPGDHRRLAGHRGRTDPRCRLDRDVSRAFETVSRQVVSATAAVPSPIRARL